MSYVLVDSGYRTMFVRPALLARQWIHARVSVTKVDMPLEFRFPRLHAVSVFSAMLSNFPSSVKWHEHVISHVFDH